MGLNLLGNYLILKKIIPVTIFLFEDFYNSFFI